VGTSGDPPPTAPPMPVDATMLSARFLTMGSAAAQLLSALSIKSERRVANSVFAKAMAVYATSIATRTGALGTGSVSAGMPRSPSWLSRQRLPNARAEAGPRTVRGPTTC
jgi:hypothetical protein